MEGNNQSQLEVGSGPWLVFFFKSRKGKDHQVFYSLAEKRSYAKNIIQIQDSVCFTTSQGWILMMNPYDEYCYLQDPITMERIKLPPPIWNFKDGECILSSSPTDPKCNVLVASLDECRLFFCQPRDKQWIEYKYDLGNNFLTEITTFNHKFCGLTMQTNFAVIDCPPNPRINILEKIDVDTPIGIGGSSTYLVPSCGKLFVLGRIFGHSDKTIHVSIMKRDFSEQSWDAVDNIDGQVFLLGANSTSASCSASELGVKENCIYFVERDDRRLYCFDIEGGFISVSMPCPDSDICTRVTPVWMVPAI